jgi:hypothetical protein
MVSRKIPNSRIKIYTLLKLILFYLAIFLKLGFSRSHQLCPNLQTAIWGIFMTVSKFNREIWFNGLA